MRNIIFKTRFLAKLGMTNGRYFNGKMKSQITIFLNMTKFIILSVILSIAVFGQVVLKDAPQLKNIDVIEHLGKSIPLDPEFTNDQGELITLGDYSNKGKPVIIVMAYYECPIAQNRRKVNNNPTKNL